MANNNLKEALADITSITEENKAKKALLKRLILEQKTVDVSLSNEITFLDIEEDALVKDTKGHQWLCSGREIWNAEISAMRETLKEMEGEIEKMKESIKTKKENSAKSRQEHFEAVLALTKSMGLGGQNVAAMHRANLEKELEALEEEVKRLKAEESAIESWAVKMKEVFSQLEKSKTLLTLMQDKVDTLISDTDSRIREIDHWTRKKQQVNRQLSEIEKSVLNPSKPKEISKGQNTEPDQPSPTSDFVPASKIPRSKFQFRPLKQQQNEDL